MTCQKCFHPKDNHKDGHFCTADLTCMCQDYVEPEYTQWEHDVQKYKAQNTTCESRVKFLLEKYPHLRNAKDKTLGKVYQSIWHAFWPSKKTIYTAEKFKEMPMYDTISRAKRFVVQKNPDLGISDPNVAIAKAAKLEAYLQLSREAKQG